MSMQKSVLLMLATQDLHCMQFEYPEVYEELFESQIDVLEKLIASKMVAIEYLERKNNKRENREEATIPTKGHPASKMPEMKRNLLRDFAEDQNSKLEDPLFQSKN
jgi:hypothetical protein